VHNRRRILPIYRVPAAVRAIPRKVELAGLEPATSWVVRSVGERSRLVAPVR
jgi:hypothetical protein